MYISSHQRERKGAPNGRRLEMLADFIAKTVADFKADPCDPEEDAAMLKVWEEMLTAIEGIDDAYSQWCAVCDIESKYCREMKTAEFLPSTYYNMPASFIERMQGDLEIAQARYEAANYIVRSYN